MGEFAVGDKVTVGSRYSIESVTEVARIGKLKMTLADGSEWKIGGFRRWAARSGGFSVVHVSLFREGDDVKLKRQRLVARIMDFAAWNQIGEADIDTLTAILDRAVEAKRVGATV